MGFLLTLLAIVPTVGEVLSIVGLVMILIADRHASGILGDSKVFTNMLHAVILGIIGLVVGSRRSHTPNRLGPSRVFLRPENHAYCP